MFFYFFPISVKIIHCSFLPIFLYPHCAYLLISLCFSPFLVCSLCLFFLSYPLSPFSQFFESHPLSPIFSVLIVLSLFSSLIKAGNKPLATPGKPKKATTFQEFESITSDAWDVGDDDDDLLAMAAQNLNIEVVMETANKVNKHMCI